MKAEIVKEIEQLWGKGFKLNLPKNNLDPLRGVMGHQKGFPKYALDDKGRLIGLNLYDTGLDDARWSKIVELLGKDLLNLQAINLNENRLSKFELPPGMQDLRMLDVSENSLTEFKLPSGMDKLVDLRIGENPLISPPPDVVKLGMHEIFKWLRAENKRPVLEAKVMFIGDSSYGKTHLIEMLKHKELKREKITTTHGIERNRIDDAKSEFGPIRLNVWDLGGQQFMRSTHQFFFTERTLYVLVTVARRERKDLNHWLQLVQEIGGAAPVLIVINKTDLDDHDIDRGPLEREYSNIVGFVRTAVFNSTEESELGVVAVDTIRKLEKEIHRIVSDKALMPSVFVEQRSEWFTVKDELEKMEDEYIGYAEYQNLPHIRTLPEDEQRLNLKQLASLGTVVSFVDDARLRDTHVINPEWIMDGVYCLINDPAIKDQRHGAFSFDDLERLLSRKRYPHDKYPFLVGLMEKFRLCYPVRYKKDTYLLPDLFSDIEPADVWPDSPDAMRFRLNYSNYPPDLFITQFIVERYNDIVGEKRWRSGVVVSDGDCQAIVRRSYKYDHIEIEVMGPGNRKRGYLHILLDVFRELHRPFDNMKVLREIPYKKFWFDFDDLLKHEENGKTKYHSELEEDIPISEILDGFGRPKELSEKFPDRGYFDEKFNEIAKGFSSLEKLIDEEFRADISEILLKMDNLKVSDLQMNRMLKDIQEIMEGIPANTKLYESWQAKQPDIKSTKLDSKGKMELVIHLIPGILSYKSEISTDFNGSIRKKLREIWNALKTGEAFVEKSSQ